MTMTAHIVGHVTRYTYPELGMPEPANVEVEGDGYMRIKYTQEDVTGQLWEREAERSPELTDRYLDAWERANRQTHTIDAEPFDRAYAFGRYSILASGRVPRRRSIFYGLTSIDDE